RAALMRGGFVRRVALGFVKIDEVLRGPWGIHRRSDHTFIVKDNWGVEYVDDELSNEEFDTLSGLYHKFLGHKREVVSVCWFPLGHIFDKSGANIVRWSDHLEALWNKRCNSISADQSVPNTFRNPLGVMEWRNKLRGSADARRAYTRLEKWSLDVWQQHLVY
ncbi:hypothetical protein AGABI1DRAFT_49691, partial [Agaricus bisporus var. burnettii JB137-S8]